MARASMRQMGWCTECGRPRLVYPATQEEGVFKDPAKAVRAAIDLGAGAIGMSLGLCKKHRAMLPGDESHADKTKRGVVTPTWFEKEKAKKDKGAK